MSSSACVSHNQMPNSLSTMVYNFKNTPSVVCVCSQRYSSSKKCKVIGFIQAIDNMTVVFKNDHNCTSKTQGEGATSTTEPAETGSPANPPTSPPPAC